MQIECGFAEVRGARLYYEIAGTGRPLVLIHGFTLDTRLWDDQFAVFARHYRVLRYDLRGFGKSSLPTESYQHEADLMALMTYLSIGRAEVIGLSQGGMVALDFAFIYPEAVRSLTLVAALYGGFHWSSAWRSRMGQIWDEGREHGVAAARQSWLSHPLFGPTLERPEAGARLARMINDYSGWHFIHDNPLVKPIPPAAERLDQTRVPTLVIVGDRDLPDFRRMADDLEQQLPLARKVVLKNVGHMPNMEAPDAFNDSVLKFLASV